MPVLYGVLMYMGLSTLRGMQFIDRVGLLFMPPKYQPDHDYLRHVPLKKVHLFTVIQVSDVAFDASFNDISYADHKPGLALDH